MIKTIKAALIQLYIVSFGNTVGDNLNEAIK